MTNHKIIHRLIERFLDAETTLDEERQLYAYFSRPDVASELEPYRAMFMAYADLEQPISAPVQSAAEAVSAPVAIPQAKPKTPPRWLWPLSIAASVVLVIAIALTAMPSADTKGICVMYEGGRAVTDEGTVVARMEQTMADVFCSAEVPDINQQMNQIRIN